MDCFKIENLKFCYPGEDAPAIDGISLDVRQGEFLTVCGTSGCGKTTLLRLLKPSISPEGKFSGTALYNGENLYSIDRLTEVKNIGFVMQNPENQIVTDKVWHEIAFGAESLGMNNVEIRIRVAEMASFFGIENWFYKNVTELSGGQKQILNLASVMVTSPSVLILDEPTSQLDPIAAQEFLSALSKINREIGTTVILSEHRLEEALPISDRVLVMEKGKPVYLGKPCNMAEKLKDTSLHSFFPTAMRVHMAVESSASSPVTVKEGRDWLSGYVNENGFTPIKAENEAIGDHETLIKLENVYFRYDKNSSDVIKKLNAEIKKSEIFAVLGGNGSGKTTMLSLISNINKPYRGKIDFFGENLKVAMLPQNPETLFVEKTVKGELYEVLSDSELSSVEKNKAVTEMVELCSLENLSDRHPYDLSGGEAERVALSKVLLTNPDIILLDEPTKGIDANFRKKLSEILVNLKSAGKTIILVSHDVEFCAEYADRCAMFFDGSIISLDKPGEFFSGKSFYTTTANRMSRGIIDNAVLTEDIICALTGKKAEKKTVCKENNLYIKPLHTEETEKKETKKEKRGISKSTILSIFMLLIAIPATIFVGKVLFDDRQYYFISLAIITEIMLPFFFSFEKRRPAAREIVLICALSALTAAGRVVLFSFPSFTPMAALVIITGVCISAESGFLVGALSVFVSNFFLSHGAWTPWQMFGFGMIGFLSGLVFKIRLIRKNRITLSLFGFLSVFFLYGFTVNFGNVIMMYSYPTWELLKTSVILGIPFDLMHAASTVFFLFVAFRPVSEKLERIKTKYGLMQSQEIY